MPWAARVARHGGRVAGLAAICVLLGAAVAHADSDPASDTLLIPLLPLNAAPGSDGLARAAIAAVEKLAADASHPLAPPKIAVSSSPPRS
jgi:hypothetical protein